jgi:hypothetical protein
MTELTRSTEVLRAVVLYGRHYCRTCKRRRVVWRARFRTRSHRGRRRVLGGRLLDLLLDGRRVPACVVGRARWARTTKGRAGLDAGVGTFKPVAMGPNEVEYAAAEFNSRVQIVSPPPDQFLNTIPASTISLELHEPGVRLLEG